MVLDTAEVHDTEGAVNLECHQILERLPHAFPFVMVDRITLFPRSFSAIGYRAFGSGEYFFQGHFPGNPIVPGVLIIEGMAQAAYLAIYGGMSLTKPTPVFITGVSDAKFRSKTSPGSTLSYNVRPLRTPSGRHSIQIFKFQCEVRNVSSNAIVASGIVSAVADIDYDSIGAQQQAA